MAGGPSLGHQLLECVLGGTSHPRTLLRKPTLQPIDEALAATLVLGGPALCAHDDRWQWGHLSKVDGQSPSHRNLENGLKTLVSGGPLRRI